MWGAFRDLRLRTKLSVISLLTTSAALLAAGLAILAVEAASGWQEAVRHHRVVAQTLANNVRSAMLFDDRNFAGQSLQVLVIQPSVRAAVLYRADGTVFAEYYAADDERDDPPPKEVEYGSAFTGGALLVAHPIELEGENLGVLAMRSDLVEYFSRLWWFGSVLLIALIGSGVLVYPLWSRLQRIISDPLNILVGVVRAVAIHNNYALRAPEQGRGELGELVDGVNRMLEQIEARDAALASYSRGLEEQVRARTEELEREVGERRRAEAQLARFKTTLDLTLDGVFMFDPATLHIFYANQGAAERTGYGVETLAEIPFPRLTPEYDTPHLRSVIGDLIGAGERGVAVDGRPWRTFETRIRRSDGSEFPAELFLQYVLIPGAGGRCVAILRDVTEQKAAALALRHAKEAAESANRAKSQFLANMSHEIRTPMNAVLGFTRLALAANPEPRHREFLRNILSSSTTLLAIIDDILDFSKIEADRMTLEQVPFNLLGLIEDLLAMLDVRAQQQEIELLAAVTPSAPATLMGDPVRLRQVLVNLVGNAIKFTQGGEVVVQVDLESQGGGEPMLRFSVRDTGIGMTETQVAQLFQPFSQADVSHTRRYGGTGLGLVISQRLVELMGGKIGVESRAGLGSRFFFSLPLQAAPEGVATEPPPLPLPLEQLRGLRALVVDDNATARHILRDTLSQFGMQVHTAASGSEALGWLLEAAERTGAAEVDLLLVDEGMPGIGGLRTIRMIRSQPLYAGVAAVLMDGLLAGTAEEPNDPLVHLAKPFTWHTVGQALLRAINPEFHPLAPGSGSAESSADGACAGAFAGTRALVAEDIPLNQLVARGMLEPYGIHVELASNGREAVARVLREPFDLVLMDVQMPEMDGYQATREIRADPRFRELPILAMTAGAMAEERQRCFDEGMNDFIPKPIDPEVLARALTRWIKPCAASAPVSPIAPPTPASAEIPPRLPGIDLKDGLQRLGQDREFYRKMLIQFRDNYADYLERIQGALSAGEMDQARSLVHALKGIAGNLSAKSLFQAASTLEDAIKAGNPPDPTVDTFRTAFIEVMEGLAGLA